MEASFDQRRDIGQSIVDEAQADAPVLTGDYRNSMALEVEGLRVFAVDNDEEAVYKEYGTVDTPPHAALTNAAVRYGEYSGWEPK